MKFWSMVSMIHEDIRFFRRIGVDGLSSDQWEGDWYPLNMYAFGKLTWNPDLKTEEIIADFCRRYYGKASDPMIAYWNLLEEGLRESWNTNAPVELAGPAAGRADREGPVAGGGRARVSTASTRPLRCTGRTGRSEENRPSIALPPQR